MSFFKKIKTTFKNIKKEFKKDKSTYLIIMGGGIITIGLAIMALLCPPHISIFVLFIVCAICSIVTTI